MAIDLNNFGICLADIIGAGQTNCRITDFGIPKGLGVIDKGTKEPVSTGAFDETTFRGWITSQKLHQLLGAFNFEDGTGDDLTETSPDQVMIVTQDALPMFTFTYKNGYNFNQALQSLKGQAKWDILIYTSKGIIMATDYAKANIKGLNAGMFQPTGYKLTAGAVREFSTVKFQLLDANEFNERLTFFSYEELGFSALEIDDAIETVVSFQTAPANLDAGVNVFLKDFGNSATNLNSLFTDAANWTVTVNGVANVVTAVTVTGDYNVLTLTTPLAATNVVKVSLNGIVEDLELKYYKSNTVTATVTA